MTMKRSFFVVLAIAIVYSFAVVPYASATPHAGYTAIPSGSCDAGTSNCGNVYAEDGSYASNTTAYMHVYTTVSIPAGSTLNSFSVYMKGAHVGGGGTGGGYTIDIGGCTGTFSYNAVTLPNSSTLAYYEKHYTDANTHVCTTGNITLDIGLSWGAGGDNRMDYIEYKAVYTVPSFTATLDASTASTSAGLAMLDMSGNFATHSANMMCQIQLFEKCEATDKAGWISQTPVAHIEFDGGSPSSTTIKTSDGYYTGESNLGTSDDWAFHKVSVPLNAGYTCTYPISYYCSHRDCSTYFINGATHTTCSSNVIDAQGQGVSNGSAYFNPTLVATPSATTSTTSDKQIDCGSDVWCQVIQRIKNTIVSIFVPSATWRTIVVEDTRSTLEAHAPFAYIYPMFTFLTTDSATNSAIPTLTFNSDNLPTHISVSMDNSIPFIPWIFNTIKSLIRLLLYGAFLVYMFNVIKRVLPQ